MTVHDFWFSFMKLYPPSTIHQVESSDIRSEAYFRRSTRRGGWHTNLVPPHASTLLCSKEYHGPSLYIRMKSVPFPTQCTRHFST